MALDAILDGRGPGARIIVARKLVANESLSRDKQL